MATGYEYGTWHLSLAPFFFYFVFDDLFIYVSTSPDFCQSIPLLQSYLF